MLAGLALTVEAGMTAGGWLWPRSMVAGTPYKNKTRPARDRHKGGGDSFSGLSCGARNPGSAGMGKQKVERCSGGGKTPRRRHFVMGMRASVGKNKA